MVSRARVVIEVDMGIQLLPVPVLVGAASEVRRIVQQVADAGQFGDEAQELRVGDQCVGGAVVIAQPANLLEGGLAADLTKFVSGPLCGERGEVPQQAFG